MRLIFTLYVGFIYTMCAVFQSIATGSKYEFSIVLINFIMFLMVAGVWFWEAFHKKNDFSQQDKIHSMENSIITASAVCLLETGEFN